MKLPIPELQQVWAFLLDEKNRAVLGWMGAGLTGLFSIWRFIRSRHDNVDKPDEEQFTKRFHKAIKQLGAINQDGKIKLEVRLGGIYALERIARDSGKESLANNGNPNRVRSGACSPRSR